MIIKQLSVFLENKKGRLAAVMSELAGHNIDVSALSLADTTDFGVLRLIVNRPEEAKRVLADEYPECDGKLFPSLPDEKTRRVGQSAAAASLPEV